MINTHIQLKAAIPDSIASLNGEKSDNAEVFAYPGYTIKHDEAATGDT